MLTEIFGDHTGFTGDQPLPFLYRDREPISAEWPHGYDEWILCYDDPDHGPASMRLNVRTPGTGLHVLAEIEALAEDILSHLPRQTPGDWEVAYLAKLPSDVSE